MTDWKKVLLGCYTGRQAIAKGDFTLKSGAKSDFYIDGRLVTTTPIGLKTIAEGMAGIIRAEKLLHEDINLVAPVLSGIPIAAALSLQLNIPFLMDRGEPKDHGRSKRFEGRFTDSAECLIVDDLITVGTTVIQTIRALQAAGKKASAVIVVVDREEGGRQALRAFDVNLYSLLTKSDLMQAWKEYRAEG